MLLLVATTIFGQELTDTVSFIADNRISVKIALPDYDELRQTDKVRQSFEAFGQALESIEDQLSAEEAEIIRYTNGTTLTIKKTVAEIIYLEKDGKLFNTGVRDSAMISGEGYLIFITTADISRFNELSVLDCLNKVVDSLQEKSRLSKSLDYECVEGSVNLLNERVNYTDLLEMNFGAGVSFIQTQWVSDLSLRLGMGLFRKSKMRFPYASANFLFDYAVESKTNINTFLNFGYSWNKGKDNMINAEVGYLVSRNGELFDPNTMKVGFTWVPVKGVNISPQLYISDGFKTAYPAIRIGFGF